MLADPERPPIVARELTAELCWMSERPLEPRARLAVKHTTRASRAIVEELISVVDMHTLENRDAPERLELNDLGVVRLRLAEPLAVDPYERNRATGAFILIDEATNDTVAAGMVLERRMTRAADPYRDLAVIDSRAPRFNQTVVGVVSLLAVATGWWWLLALLALQLALGLTLGRRWCLPCLAYFELIQPRFGEGALEDSRPPRAANMVGFAVLSAASLAYAAGLTALGVGLGLLVAALALLAATTGFCTGCEAYKLGRRLTGRPFVSCPIPPRPAA